MIGIALAAVLGILLIGSSLRKREKQELERFKQRLYTL